MKLDLKLISFVFMFPLNERLSAFSTITGSEQGEVYERQNYYINMSIIMIISRGFVVGVGLVVKAGLGVRVLSRVSVGLGLRRG